MPVLLVNILQALAPTRTEEEQSPAAVTEKSARAQAQRSSINESSAKRIPRESESPLEDSILDDLGDEGSLKDSESSEAALLVDPPTSLYQKFKSFISPPHTHSSLRDLSPSYRYTPIVSGLVIPFSILLEIPGLTGNWYIRTEANSIVETKSNPTILDVGLGLSMACAVIANVCLVLRFMEKRVMTMTVLCVTFLSIHDIINIIAVTTFGIEHRFSDGFTYGQSFWATVCSTAASTFTNITLILDLKRTSNFAKSGSGLTRKQRSLIVMVIVLLSYIALGSLINCFLIGLEFIDALYFTVASIETIGFGDVVPVSAGARVFVCAFATFGIVNLALAVSLARETVLEALEASSRKRLQNLQEKRKAVLRRRRVEVRWREAIGWRLSAQGREVWVDDEECPAESVFFKLLPVVGRRMQRSHTRRQHRRLNLEGLTRAQLHAAAMEVGVPLHTLLPEGFRFRDEPTAEGRPGLKVRSRSSEGGFPRPEWTRTRRETVDDSDIPLTHARLGRMVSMVSNFATAFYHSPDNRDRFRDKNQQARQRKDSGVTPRATLVQQIYEDFDEDVAEGQEVFYVKLAVAWSLFFGFWMSGAAIFSRTEGWTYAEGLYFCFISFTTLGYGDFSLKTPTGRAVFVAWALLGVATMTILISVVSEAYSERYKKAMHSVMFAKAVKRYRARAREETSAAPRASPSVLGAQDASDSVQADQDDPSSSKEGEASDSSAREPKADADKDSASRGSSTSTSGPGLSHTQGVVELERLPHEVLQHAHAFHSHIRYFMGNHRHPQQQQQNSTLPKPFNSAGEHGTSLPAGPGDAEEAVGMEEDGVPITIKKLLDDIAGGAENLGQRMKEEILQDDDARKTLFLLSMEDGIRSIVTSAERAILALEEKDAELRRRYPHAQTQLQE